MKRNILIGKFGKAIKFNKEKWDIVGGNNGIYNLIIILTKYNPESNFYLLSPSDFHTLSKEERMELFPNDNLYQLPTKNYTDPIEFIREKKIHIDIGIFMAGMSVNVALPDKIQKIGSTEFAKTLVFAKKYISPIVHTLNELQCPFFTLSEDPRNTVLKQRDLFNIEKFCLALENSNYSRKHIISYDNQDCKVCNVPVKFAHVELLALYGKEKYSMDNNLFEKKELNIFMNKFGINSTTTRKPFVEEYILPNFPEARIYGRWDRNDGDNYISKMIREIPEVINRTKYTVIYSLKPGFISAKPWEMINMGIIPFLHPDYDFNKLIGLPDFLYLKSPQDLLDKVKWLEKNPSSYKIFLSELLNLIEDDYLNGRYINNVITGNIENELYNGK